MADGDAVFAGLPQRDDVTFIALALNLRGVERALAIELAQNIRGVKSVQSKELIN